MPPTIDNTPQTQDPHPVPASEWDFGSILELSEALLSSMISPSELLEDTIGGLRCWTGASMPSSS
jgi:hypothetical protein